MLIDDHEVVNAPVRKHDVAMNIARITEGRRYLLHEAGKHRLKDGTIAVDRLMLIDRVAQHRLGLAKPLEEEALRLALAVVV